MTARWGPGERFRKSPRWLPVLVLPILGYLAWRGMQPRDIRLEVLKEEISGRETRESLEKLEKWMKGKGGQELAAGQFLYAQMLLELFREQEILSSEKLQFIKNHAQEAEKAGYPRDQVINLLAEAMEEMGRQGRKEEALAELRGLQRQFPTLTSGSYLPTARLLIEMGGADHLEQAGRDIGYFALSARDSESRIQVTFMENSLARKKIEESMQQALVSDRLNELLERFREVLTSHESLQQQLENVATGFGETGRYARPHFHLGELNEFFANLAEKVYLRLAELLAPEEQLRQIGGRARRFLRQAVTFYRLAFETGKNSVEEVEDLQFKVASVYHRLGDFDQAKIFLEGLRRQAGLGDMYYAARLGLARNLLFRSEASFLSLSMVQQAEEEISIFTWDESRESAKAGTVFVGRLAVSNQRLLVGICEKLGEVTRILETRDFQEKLKLMRLAGRTGKELDGLESEYRKHMEENLIWFMRAGDTGMELASHEDKLSDQAGALWQASENYRKIKFHAGCIGALRRFNELVVAGDNRASLALHLLGEASRAQGMYDQALETFLRNVNQFPNSIYTYRSLLSMADTYVTRGGKGDPDKAIEVLRMIVEGEFFVPATEELRRRIQNFNFSPATDVWQQALGKLGRVYYERAVLEEEVKKQQEGLLEAVRLLGESVNRFPALPDGEERYFYLGQAYLHLYFTHLNLTNLNHAAAILEQGISRLGEIQGAEKSGEEKPGEGKREYLEKQMLLMLGDIYFVLSRRTEGESAQANMRQALDYYDRVTQKYFREKEGFWALYQSGNCYRLLGQTERAKIFLERAKWSLDRLELRTEELSRMGFDTKFWQEMRSWSENLVALPPAGGSP